MTRVKFKIGDKIAGGGSPGLVYIVENVQTNSDGRGSFYHLAAPDGTSHEASVEMIDKTSMRSAREFNRQLAAIEKEFEDKDENKN